MKWFPRRTDAETKVATKLRKASAFYRFLWEIREELFDEEFQVELEKSYEPRGQEPCPPALLAMVNLLQRYDGLSDADAVEAAENDRRWQLVLGCLDTQEAPFGQGTLVRFRMRSVANDLDQKLVNRTVELAKKTGSFGWKNLRAALDSSPLHGAGRVEDTWNLIGRAMTKVVHAVSMALNLDEETVIKSAGLSVLTADSIKSALDVDWDDNEAKMEALERLLSQVDALEAWIAKRAADAAAVPPLKEPLATLRRIVDQDIEPDPTSGGRRIKQEVAKDRIISISDPEMRHGRKSKTKLFNGYKRHIAIANNLVLATTVVPANIQEHQAAATLLERVAEHGTVDVVDIDRGYLSSDAIAKLHQEGVTINSKPWVPTNKGLFTKLDFDIDARRKLVTCPNGKTARAVDSGKATFSVDDCQRCKLKSSCTTSESRSIALHPNEGMLIQLRRRKVTRRGRKELRKRVKVEHKLARIAAVQGDTARYVGARKNEFDLNRTAAILNLQETARLRAA